MKMLPAACFTQASSTIGREMDDRHVAAAVLRAQALERAVLEGRARAAAPRLASAVWQPTLLRAALVAPRAGPPVHPVGAVRDGPAAVDVVENGDLGGAHVLPVDVDVARVRIRLALAREQKHSREHEYRDFAVIPHRHRFLRFVGCLTRCAGIAFRATSLPAASNSRKKRSASDARIAATPVTSSPLDEGPGPATSPTVDDYRSSGGFSF